MARPTPCIGCGVQLGEDSELTLKYSDPFDCTTEGGLILKHDSTLQVVGGELGVVPSTYPTLNAEASWGGGSVTGLFIDTGSISADTTIRFPSDQTISVVNTTDKIYVVRGEWQILTYFAAGSEGFKYSIFLDSTINHNGTLIPATSEYDGLVYGRFGSGDVIQQHVACAGQISLMVLNPGEYLNWGGAPAYRVGTTGNTANTIGYHFARFSLVGTAT